MITINKITIIGNLTRDPELRTTSTDLNVCTFTVAVNRRKEGVDFFRVTAWRQLGENCHKFLQKGRKVAVVGSVSVSTYEAKDGTTKATLEVVAEDVEFLGAKGEESEPATQTQDGFTQVEDEDLPF